MKSNHILTPLNETSFYKLRNDEMPNIELGKKIAKNNDKHAFEQIMDNLDNENNRLASDCMKVVSIAAEFSPELAADYVSTFLDLLSSNNKRLVWGSMTTLSYIAEIKPDEIFLRIDEVISAYREGSVITRDTAITVFAQLCAAKENYFDNLFSLLLHHLTNCKDSTLYQHASRTLTALENPKINKNTARKQIINVLEKRKNSLNHTRFIKIDKLIKKTMNV